MFVAEGIKTVEALLKADVYAEAIFTTEQTLFEDLEIAITHITDAELLKMSNFKTPNKVLGIFQMPKPKAVNFSDWVVVLDGIRDPGNLGTIIRLCDWFGISQLICSEDTVDCYNPKVLQATMGSIARVTVQYTNIESLVKQSNLPVWGTFMDGIPVYKQTVPKSGILLLGNEANGISKPMEALVDTRVGIPAYGNKMAESLNVAMAAAIFLNEIRRPGDPIQK